MKCSLSQKTSQSKIQESSNIPAIEFSDNILGLYRCLCVLYGGSVSIDIINYKSLFKFGKLFQIQEMMECVLKWVSEELPYDMFWDVSQDLIKMEVALTSDSFRDAIERYISNDYQEFWHYMRKLCLEDNKNAVREVIDILSRTDIISCEDMLTFLSDLLNAITEKRHTPSSTSDSTSEKCVNSVVTYTVSYLENKVKSDLNSSCSLCSKYLNILKKLTTVCNETESFLKISILQNDAYSMLMALLCKEVDLCTSAGLTRELIERLTNPSTTYDTIRYFTEYASKDIHPCVIGEIVLKWWRINRTECPDMTFIKNLFTKIDDIYDRWLDDANDDIRYKELFHVIELDTKDTKYLYCYCNHKGENMIVLTQCIEKGNGADLIFPINHIEYTQNMAVYGQNMPVFRYNTAMFPPYGVSNGHWYLVFYYENDTFSMVSLITESQQDLLDYLESCYDVGLHFIPSPDSN